jgi:glutamate 5-kinase
MRVVVKIGSSALLQAGGQRSYQFAEFAHQIGELVRLGHEVALVSSGAVLLARNGRFDPARKMSSGLLASYGQHKLMHHWQNAFSDAHIKVSQLLLTRYDLQSERQSSLVELFEESFAHQIIPIVNENDPLIDAQMTFGNNDALAVLLATKIRADLIVLVTDVRGFFDKDPKKHPDARVVPLIDSIGSDLFASVGAMSAFGTGGMAAKLEAARQALEHRIPMLISSGDLPQLLLRACAHEDGIGTWFRMPPS